MEEVLLQPPIFNGGSGDAVFPQDCLSSIRNGAKTPGDRQQSFFCLGMNLWLLGIIDR